VIGFGRRPAKTRSEMFRDELGETFDHLKQAASHGADTVSTAVRPRMSAARTVAMGTAAGAMAKMAAARQQPGQRAGEAARKMMPMMGRKKRKREMARQQRSRRLAGLLALGATVGAVGALVGRRRRQTSWETYDTSTRPPQKPVEMSESSGPQSESSSPTAGSSPAAGSQSRQPMPGKGTSGVGPLAEQARNALSGATEPDAAEANVISPGTQPSSNRRR
jgi:hypothetical protein